MCIEKLVCQEKYAVRIEPRILLCEMEKHEFLVLKYTCSKEKAEKYACEDIEEA